MPPFAYFKRLNPVQKHIYRASDAVTSIRVPQPELLFSWIEKIRSELELDDPTALEQVLQKFSDLFLEKLSQPLVKIVVLAVRPHSHRGELHGLYQMKRGWVRPRITIWMRTAKLQKTVKFKTLFRTLLHELVHHLDYTHLKLRNSFHTLGFYQRESSLLRQLLPSSASTVPK